VDQVIDPSGYAALGFPAPTPESQMGQLLLTAKPGYAFTGAVTGEPVNPAREGGLGSHGYLASDPQLGAIFIASGRGIKPGVVLDSVRTIDLAPTMARLLGVELPKTDGRALTEILAEQ
jgi:predicted AlkP superfamily pyrophosphatase or phosphodiesterase